MERRFLFPIPIPFLGGERPKESANPCGGERPKESEESARARREGANRRRGAGSCPAGSIMKGGTSHEGVSSSPGSFLPKSYWRRRAPCQAS